MSRSNELTARQTEIFNFVIAECSAGRTVGVRDIAAKFEFQPNAAKGHVDALYKKGFLESEKTATGQKNRANSIRPVGMVPITNNAYSRTGENFAVNVVNGGEFVAFMIFNNGKMIESGLYPVLSALTMADNMRIDATLAVVDRIAAVAAKVAAKRVPVAVPVAGEKIAPVAVPVAEPELVAVAAEPELVAVAAEPVKPKRMKRVKAK